MCTVCECRQKEGGEGWGGGRGRPPPPPLPRTAPQRSRPRRSRPVKPIRRGLRQRTGPGTAGTNRPQGGDSPGRAVREARPPPNGGWEMAGATWPRSGLWDRPPSPLRRLLPRNGAGRRQRPRPGSARSGRRAGGSARPPSGQLRGWPAPSRQREGAGPRPPLEHPGSLPPPGRRPSQWENRQAGPARPRTDERPIRSPRGAGR